MTQGSALDPFRHYLSHGVRRVSRGSRSLGNQRMLEVGHFFVSQPLANTAIGSEHSNDSEVPIRHGVEQHLSRQVEVKATLAIKRTIHIERNKFDFVPIPGADEMQR